MTLRQETAASEIVRVCRFRHHVDAQRYRF